MKLHIVRSEGPAVEADWDDPEKKQGAYSRLLKLVEKTGGDVAAGCDEDVVLYYVDHCDDDEIVMRTDDDVAEFVDYHTGCTSPPAVHLRRAVRTPLTAETALSSSKGTSTLATADHHPQHTPDGASHHTDDNQEPPSSPMLVGGGKRFNWGKGQLLGAGAGGKVFLGIDHNTGDLIAVKEVLLHSDGNPKALKREIDLMRPLQHHNIVRYYGTQQTTTALHIIMEYVPGGSISGLLAKLGPFSEPIIRHYTSQICAGLGYLHSKGIVHRDIKGGNCLVGVDGTVKLADFGCSVRVGSGEGVRISTEFRVLGTSLWMSPEACQCRDVSYPTDIWSLGCTVVEMASAQPPWKDAHFINEWAAMFYISSTKSGPPIPPHLSRQAHDLLKRCFAIDPAQRPLVGEVGRHPFVTETFDDQSHDPAMHPPEASELSPAPVFPRLPPVDHPMPRAETAASCNDMLSSAASFSPLDLRDELDDSVLMADSDEDSDHSPLASPARAPHPPPQGLETLPSLTRNAHLVDAVPEESPPPADEQGHEASLVSCTTAITAFLKKRAVHRGTQESRHHRVTLLDLPDGVVYNMLFFLEYADLCRISQCNRALHAMELSGRNELLWRRLFVADFGEVSVLVTALRKNWKTYYAQSKRWKGEVVHDRFVFLRKLTYSPRVFEGVDSRGGSVIIKLEHKRTHQGVRYETTSDKSRPPSLNGSLGTSTVWRPHHTPGKGYTGGIALKPLSSSDAMQSPPLTASRAPNTPPSPAKPPRPGGSPRVPFHTTSPLALRGEVQHAQRNPRPGQFPAGPPLPIAGASRSPKKAPTRPKGGLSPPVVAPFQANTSTLRETMAQARLASLFHSSEGRVGSPDESQHSGVLSSSPLKSRWDAYEYVTDQERLEQRRRDERREATSWLIVDHRVTKELSDAGVDGVLTPIWFGTHTCDRRSGVKEAVSVYVMPAAGPVLNDLLLFCGNRFSVKTVCLLAIKALRILRQVHGEGIVHCNISPSNILVGRDSDPASLTLINFGCARSWLDRRTRRISTSRSCVKMRNREHCYFSSVNLQTECTPSPRDDLVSLAYVLYYVLNGGLPWLPGQVGAVLGHKELVVLKKRFLTDTRDMRPLQLHVFLKSVSSIRSNDFPDYSQYEDWFRGLLAEQGCEEDDEYDWSAKLGLPKSQGHVPTSTAQPT